MKFYGANILNVPVKLENRDLLFSPPEAVASVSAEKPPPSLWSDGEILALMEIWGEEDVQRALRGSVHNGYVYAEISERMQDLGFSKTSEQCRWKVKSLRNNFRQCYDKKKCARTVGRRLTVRSIR